MNHLVPDWSMENDLRSFDDLFPASNDYKFAAEDDDLEELLWRNGHVVMQSQSTRKTPPSFNEIKQAQKPDTQLQTGNLIQEDEALPWFPYPLHDSLDKDVGLEFLYETPITDTINPNKPNKEAAVDETEIVKCMSVEDSNAFTMPPPKSQIGGMGSLKASSIRKIESSACGSNQVQNQADLSHTFGNSVIGARGKRIKEYGPMISPRESNVFDATMTSSSCGGSGYSLGRTTVKESPSDWSYKRKGRDRVESEFPSEEAEYESMETSKQTQRPASTCKTRAAEVHNLSERRRRDRINEKMKALQELIPHCNKSDKASMLDEAIEYLKSLQLQLQLMWMGSGMAPMLFPGAQHYMTRMGHASMPSINNAIPLSRSPLLNHSAPTPNVNPFNFQTHLQNIPLHESHARYFGFPQMNLYAYGSPIMQQNPTAGRNFEHMQNGHPG